MNLHQSSIKYACPCYRAAIFEGLKLNAIDSTLYTNVAPDSSIMNGFGAFIGSSCYDVFHL